MHRALALLVVLLAGCLEPDVRGPPSQSEDAPVDPPASGLEPLTLRTLAQGSFSRIHEETRELVRDDPAWRALWAAHSPDEPAPAVAFPDESVLAVVVPGPTGCFGIHLGDVAYDRDARAVLVDVVHERTPDDVNCIAAIQDAFHFAAIPARGGTVVFRDVDSAPSQPAPPPPPPAITPSTTPSTTPAPDVIVDPSEARGEYGFRTLAEGSASGIKETTRRVLRNEDEWRAFWEAHGSTQMPPPEMPAVDFAWEHVFAATAGARSSTCWSIRVEHIEQGAQEVTVSVRTGAPPPDAFCGSAITYPFHFVTYPVTKRPVRVVESG